jgi:hypothetical protein
MTRLEEELEEERRKRSSEVSRTLVAHRAISLRLPGSNPASLPCGATEEEKAIKACGSAQNNTSLTGNLFKNPPHI